MFLNQKVPLNPEVCLPGTILNLLNASPFLVSLRGGSSIKSLIDTPTRSHHMSVKHFCADHPTTPSVKRMTEATHPPLKWPVEEVSVLAIPQKGHYHSTQAVGNDKTQNPQTRTMERHVVKADSSKAGCFMRGLLIGSNRKPL